MTPDFDSFDVENLKKYFSNYENWQSCYFSLGKNSFVLKDNNKERLILTKGPATSSGKMKNIGPAKIKILSGDIELRILDFFITTDKEGTSRVYKSSGKVHTRQLINGKAESINYNEAVEIIASQNALWLLQFEKSSENAICITFDSETLQPERQSLIYHSHSRLFNYVEVLARSTCHDSLKALQKLTKSSLDELAWRAIEGIHHREPNLAKALLKQYMTSHPSNVVQKRALTIASTMI